MGILNCLYQRVHGEKAVLERKAGQNIKATQNHLKFKKASPLEKLSKQQLLE